MQSHCNQRCAADDYVDPDKQSHFSGRRPWDERGERAGANVGEQHFKHKG
jgi:hypothetical protein